MALAFEMHSMQSNSRGGEKSFPSAPLHQGGNLPLQKKNPEPIISVEYRLGKICHAKSRLHLAGTSISNQPPQIRVRATLGN